MCDNRCIHTLLHLAELCGGYNNYDSTFTRRSFDGRSTAYQSSLFIKVIKITVT